MRDGKRERADGIEQLEAIIAGALDLADELSLHEIAVRLEQARLMLMARRPAA